MLNMILATAVACLIPILALTWVITLLFSGLNANYASPSPWRWAVGFIIPLYMVTRGIRKKSLSQSGAIAALVIGFIMTISCTRFMFALMAFFIFASKATRYKSSEKRKFEVDFKEGGQRNWRQVVCNGGPATILAILYMFEVGSIDLPIDFYNAYSASWYTLGVLASIACSSGDTFASEIGSVSGKKDPFHITLWIHVPRGTNGAVSFIGTLSSFFGGFTVGLAFYIAILISTPTSYLADSPPQWPVIIYAAVAGGLGSLIDSLLGATLQYSGIHTKLGYVVEHSGPDIRHISGTDILDNHSVNLLSSILTALIIPLICARTWPLSS